MVYKVRRIVDNNIYVLKQINMSGMSNKEQDAAINECRILATLNSPHVVQYYDSFLEASALYIIMEFCANGDLHKYLKVVSLFLKVSLLPTLSLSLSPSLSLLPLHRELSRPPHCDRTLLLTFSFPSFCFSFSPLSSRPLPINLSHHDYHVIMTHYS